MCVVVWDQCRIKCQCAIKWFNLYVMPSERLQNLSAPEEGAMHKNTICLWYDGDAEDAARFYAATFPDSRVGAVLRAPGDYPAGKEGDVLTVAFTVLGLFS